MKTIQNDIKRLSTATIISIIITVVYVGSVAHICGKYYQADPSWKCFGCVPFVIAFFVWDCRRIYKDLKANEPAHN